MPIDITEKQYGEGVDTALDWFADGLLAILRETPNKGYTPQEIARLLRERAGIPEPLKLVLDIIAVFSPEVAQANTAARESYEEMLNRLVEQGKVRVRIEAGTSYYYAPERRYLLN